MPNPQELLDFARTLSQGGNEDLHLQLLSRQANKRKELLQVLDELLEVHVNAQIVSILRGMRAIDAKPGPAKLRAAREPKRTRAG